MTRDGTYTGQLRAIVNEKYEKHTMAMKDWQPLHDRMHASQRHLKKLNEPFEPFDRTIPGHRRLRG